MIKQTSVWLMSTMCQIPSVYLQSIGVGGLLFNPYNLDVVTITPWKKLAWGVDEL